LDYLKQYTLLWTLNEYSEYKWDRY
jgi:hypothetical protein